MEEEDSLLNQAVTALNPPPAGTAALNPPTATADLNPPSAPATTTLNPPFSPPGAPFRNLPLLPIPGRFHPMDYPPYPYPPPYPFPYPPHIQYNGAFLPLPPFYGHGSLYSIRCEFTDACLAVRTWTTGPRRANTEDHDVPIQRTRTRRNTPYSRRTPIPATTTPLLDTPTPSRSGGLVLNLKHVQRLTIIQHKD